MTWGNYSRWILICGSIPVLKTVFWQSMHGLIVAVPSGLQLPVFFISVGLLLAQPVILLRFFRRLVPELSFGDWLGCLLAMVIIWLVMAFALGLLGWDGGIDSLDCTKHALRTSDTLKVSRVVALPWWEVLRPVATYAGLFWGALPILLGSLTRRWCAALAFWVLIVLGACFAEVLSVLGEVLDVYAPTNAEMTNWTDRRARIEEYVLRGLVGALEGIISGLGLVALFPGSVSSFFWRLAR